MCCAKNKMSQKIVAAKFSVSQSQVSQIWKTKEKLLQSHSNNINPSWKHARESSQKDVEEVLLLWFTQAKSQGLKISCPMLQQKAKDFGKTRAVQLELLATDFDSSIFLQPTPTPDSGSSFYY